MIIPDKNVRKKKDNAEEKKFDDKKLFARLSFVFNFGGGTRDGEGEEIHKKKKKEHQDVKNQREDISRKIYE